LHHLALKMPQCGVTLMQLEGSNVSRAKSTRRNVRISVSLDEKEYAELARLAAELDLSAAWMIRRAVSDFISRYGNGADPTLPLDRSPQKPAARKRAGGSA
jgi:hypothetical protein